MGKKGGSVEEGYRERGASLSSTDIHNAAAAADIYNCDNTNTNSALERSPPSVCLEYLM